MVSKFQFVEKKSPATAGLFFYSFLEEREMHDAFAVCIDGKRPFHKGCFQPFGAAPLLFLFLLLYLGFRDRHRLGEILFYLRSLFGERRQNLGKCAYRLIRIKALQPQLLGFDIALNIKCPAVECR